MKQYMWLEKVFSQIICCETVCFNGFFFKNLHLQVQFHWRLKFEQSIAKTNLLIIVSISNTHTGKMIQ